MPNDAERLAAELGPAARYEHDHPPVRNPIAEHEEQLTLGQRVADRVASIVGSWPFIIIQSVLLFLWMGVNVYLVVQESMHPGFLHAWDPYPFILLNLVLSFQAAYTGPVVMMAQNRQAEKDRLTAVHDFEIDQKAEEEICVIMQHLGHQDRLIIDAIARLESLQVTPPVRDVVQKIEAILERLDANDRRIATVIDRIEKLHRGTPPLE